jgi:hypothetical protein
MDYTNILENSFYSIKLLMDIIETNESEIKKIDIIQKKLYKWLN